MKIFLYSSLLLSTNLFSQVGINTNNPSATLDVEAINNDSDGILIPVVNKFSDTSPGSGQNSMLVYYDDNSPNNSGLNGFYFWDNDNNIWQYIFQSKMIEMNLFKIMVKSNSKDEIEAGKTITNNWFKSKLQSIEAPNPNSKLEKGNLIIGKSGWYSINFSGQVGKGVGSTSATLTEIGIFINDNSDPDIPTTPTFLSSTPLPSADNGDRYVTHSISDIYFFKKGERISIKTRHTSNINTSFKYSENYTLTLSYLNSIQ